MGVTATTRLPAGWYPDPEGGNRRRWWDGREWTQYTAEFQRPTSVDEVEIVTPTSGTSRRRKSTKSAEPKAVKQPKTSRSAKAPKKAPVSSTKTGAAETTDAHAEHHRPAERLGRLLAGAAYALPTIKLRRKRRRAHRSTN